MVKSFKRQAWLMAAIAALVASSAGSGCSSNSSGGGNSACISSEVGASCYSCGQSHCGSQVNAFFSACSDYTSCFCSGSTYNATAHDSQACQDKLNNNASCKSANDAVSSCALQNCVNECSSGGASSGGTSSGGGSSGAGSSGASSSGAGTSSSGATGNYTACGISSINTQSCATCIMSSCCSVTQACASDSACNTAVMCISNCTIGDTACTDACVASTSTAVQTELTNMSNCWTNTCGPSGC